MNLIEFGDCRDTMRRWAEQGVKAPQRLASVMEYVEAWAINEGVRFTAPEDAWA